jgi:hypothetical protein
MKLRIGKRKDVVEEAREAEDALRSQLEVAERRRKEFEDARSATPILDVKNVEDVEKVEKVVPPVKLSKEDQAALNALQEVLKSLECYGGVFPEMGPSGHYDVSRTLLLGIFGELRSIRLALEK